MLRSGDRLLLHSDGLAEAHNREREMYGFPRVAELAGRDADGGQEMIDLCLSELDAFTGSSHEQEDDITLVVLECTQHGGLAFSGALDPGDASGRPAVAGEEILDEFEVPSEPGNERIAFKRVAELVAGSGLSPERTERLKTAVAEATMNAIEHGNENMGEVPVEVRVLRSGDRIVVTITDQGGEHEDPAAAAETPDLLEKLEGRQRPRGWGLFLIEKMVDYMQVETEGRRHTVRLTIRIDDPANEEGEADGEHV